MPGSDSDPDSRPGPDSRSDSRPGSPSDAGPGVRTLAVTPAEAGQKLLSYLARRVGPGAPQSLLHRWVRSGQVRVDGRRAKPFQRLSEGQTVRIPPYTPGAADAPRPDTAPRTASETATAPRAPLPIVFRSGDVLVIHKPAGLPVHGGTGHGGAGHGGAGHGGLADGDSVVARLRAMFPDADFAPTPAHRLDRDTSGLLAVGLGYAGLRALQEHLAGPHAAKTYLAWADGDWPAGPGPDGDPDAAPSATPDADSDLSADPSGDPDAAPDAAPNPAPSAAQDGEIRLADRLEKAGPAGAEKVRRAADGAGKAALAFARILERRVIHGRPATLLAVRLVTGRTHQIRAQLAARGHPVLGDRKYGGPPAPGLMLHAWRLTLPPGLAPDPIQRPPAWPAPYAPAPARVRPGGPGPDART